MLKVTRPLVVYLVPILLVGCLFVFILLYWWRPSWRQYLHKLWVGFYFEAIVSVLLLAVSVMSVYFAGAYFHDTRKEQWEGQTHEIRQSLIHGFDANLAVLIGAKGLFDSHPQMTRQIWANYVASLNLRESFPGLQGLGFAAVVSPDGLDEFSQQVRAEGFSDFQLHPEGERDFYTSILYLEPFDERNRRAFGYDMWSESTRRAAMQRSIDAENPVVSGGVLLLQETETDVQTGFLIYAPVYKNQELIGFVFAPVRTSDFVHSAINFNPDLASFRIFDGLKLQSDNVIFENIDRFDQQKNNIDFRKTETIYLSNHPWTIEFINNPAEQVSLLIRLAPYLVFGFTFVIAVLISVISHTSARSRRRAVDLASKLTSELQNNVDELQKTKKAVLNILEDVSAEKQNLLQLTTRFNLAKKAAALGVWEWDLRSQKFIVDEQMHELFDIKPSDFTGDFQSWIDLMRSTDKPQILRCLHESIKHSKDMDCIWQVMLGSGRKRYLQTHAFVERDEQGVPLRMIGVNFDVTTEQEIDQAKTEFISLASHQLRTPLSVINWYLELLITDQQEPLSVKQRELLTEAYQSSQRMSSLVSALLNVARIEAGTFMVSPKQISLVAVIKTCIKEIEPKLADKNITIDFQAADLPEMNLDPNLTQIICHNLLTNAVKYSPDHSQVEVRLSRDNGGVLLSVADHGLGVPQSEQEQLFDKLFRASNAAKSQQEGTGLGLYIVKKIITEVGGKVWFESTESAGSTFYVWLPASGMIKKEGDKKLD